MQHLSCSRDDGVAVLRMARPKANALNDSLITELRESLAESERDPEVRALVLASDCPRFFSAGFDALEVFAYQRPEMSAFFGRFIDLYQQMIWFPKPLIAAVNGHAFAGGAVLALMADARVMLQGKYWFALNEVKLGVVLPPDIIRMAVHVMGWRCAQQLLLTGRSIDAAEASRIGLVQEVSEEGEVLAGALRIAKSMGAQPRNAFFGVKRLLLTQAGFGKEHSDREWLEPFLDHWFSPESVTARTALASELKAD